MGIHATLLRRLRHPGFAIAVACGLLAAAGPAQAAIPHGSGGAGLVGDSGSGSSGGDSSGSDGAGPPPESTKHPVVDRVNARVSVHGDGITLITRASGQTHHRITFRGAATGDSGRLLEIEYRRRHGRKWHKIARTTVPHSGKFKVRWRARAAGRLNFRAIVLPASGANPPNSATPSAASGPKLTRPLDVTVFRTARATYYGPGFWGNRTACGQRLRRRTLGVASRKLRCGTKVAVYYRGKEIVVPVIDRGPYGRHHARWDLTMATAKALGIHATAKVGTLRTR